MNKEQLKALRNAQRLSFNHKEGKGKIVAYKMLPAKGEYPETELRTEIEVNSKVNSCREGVLTDTATCHALEYNDGRSAMHLRTAVGFLKAGDEVALEWCKDYETNAYMEEAGLHGDRLVLIVTRKGKNYPFNIRSSCSKDAYGRMIR